METCVLRTTLVALLLTGWWSSFRLFALERLEPADGCYLGIDLGATDTIAGLAERLGITPAVFVRFFDFPMSTSDRGELTNFLNEVLANGGIAMITLEPSLGLDSVSQTVCVDLGTLCAAYEQRGIDGIIIRFGHEMNGNWYAWGNSQSYTSKSSDFWRKRSTRAPPAPLCSGPPITAWATRSGPRERSAAQQILPLSIPTATV